MPRGIEILIEKALPEPVAGVGTEHLHRPSEALDLGAEFVHALGGGEISLERMDLRARRAEGLRCGHDVRLVGGDDEIVPVPRQQQRQFIADARRCAGHDSKRPRPGSAGRGIGLGHGMSFQGLRTTLMQPSFLSRNWA